MICDICGEEVDNSEALAQHKERMHATGADNPEPAETGELPEEQDMPEPAQQRGQM